MSEGQQSGKDNTAPQTQSTEGEGSSAQPSTNTTLKVGGKRKPYIKRSGVWLHMTEYFDKDGNRRCKCNYCPQTYAASSKSCGTSTLWSHVRGCQSNPANISSSQTQLTLQSNNDDEDIPSQESKVSLVPWKFDQQEGRKALASMIIIDELPFRFVEGIGFKKYMRVCQPAHVIPSRSTVTRDCLLLYRDEKEKLRVQMKHEAHRVCLTTDAWTSVQQINYMCVTAHFIDNDWNLQKRVINFCPVSSHRGHDIGVILEMTIKDWELQNVLTVTVDNASSNDVAIDYIKRKMIIWKDLCVLDAKWTHVRCVAHILNLIVQDGLKKVGQSVEKVRAAVKFVRQSPGRVTRFMNFAKNEDCECSKSLCLDVSTRWNSTYLMLNVAQAYERAFDRLYVHDATYREDMNSKGGAPTSFDWKNVRTLVTFLEHFYELTLKISGTKYITANSFLDDISCIHGLLKDCLLNDDDELVNMAIQMKGKFDKYWGCPEKFNMLVFIASMLDPRNKFEYVDIVFNEMYGKEEGSKLAKMGKEAFFELFNEYKRIYAPSPSASLSSSASITSSSLRAEKSVSSSTSEPLNRLKEKFRSELKKRKAESGVKDSKSELEKYLTENDDDDETAGANFSVLKWWKVNSPRFPILSLLARDVLAIPISTVASESVFSTGGRVLDAFRSSLTPRVVQALICTQDWLLRSRGTPVNAEENVEELEKFERGIQSSSVFFLLILIF